MKSAVVTDPPPLPAPSSPWSDRRRVLAAAAILVLAAFLAYHNSFHGEFLYDDWPTIIENQSIRDLSNLRDVLLPPTQHTAAGRPLLNLSFAINYAWSGEEEWSYHVLNLVVHMLAGLAMFGLVRRTLELPLLRSRFGAHAVPLGFAVALLWMLHPLQTESVTYIVQRGEALMGLFYALTLYGFARSILEPGKRRWKALAIGACIFGMASKEVMVSAPVIALLYHRAFAGGSFARTLREQWPMLLGFAACWGVLAIALASTGGNRGGSVGIGIGVGFVDYWLTQPRALAYYLKLALWPDPLVFEYGTEWITHWRQVVPFALLIVPLVALALVAIFRWPRIGFLGAWFLAIHAPTSLTPGINQMIVEHRTYLSLAAIVALVVLGAYVQFGRRSLVVWPLIALVFGMLTVRRNRDYRDVLTLWTDTVEKRPHNALAQRILADFLWQDTNYGVRYDRLPKALEHYRKSLELQPLSSATHENYGAALLLTGDVEGGIHHTRRALEIMPDSYLAYHNLGLGYARQGRFVDAVIALEKAVRLKPDYLNAQKNLGNALFEAGRPVDAIRHYEAALKLKPDDPEAHHNFGNALYKLGRYDEAIAHYEAALKTRPDNADTHRILAESLARVGRRAEALQHLDRAAALHASPSRAHERAQPGSGPQINAGRR